MKKLLICVLILCCSLFGTNAYANNEMKVDNILVEKSVRKMMLRHGDKVIKEYKISLGPNPKGHKVMEGDNRTPEGEYVISGRNPKSSYHLSLRISYPNAEDKKRAKELNLKPGGDIMIHGFPNNVVNMFFDKYHKTHDWTAGCIAVTDDEIEEIWDLVDNGTKIVIMP